MITKFHIFESVVKYTIDDLKKDSYWFLVNDTMSGILKVKNISLTKIYMPKQIINKRERIMKEIEFETLFLSSPQNFGFVSSSFDEDQIKMIFRKCKTFRPATEEEIELFKIKKFGKKYNL